MAELIPSYRDIVNAPMILCNGAALFDPVARRDIYADLLDKTDTLAALGFIRREFPETQLFVYIGDDYTQVEDIYIADDRRGWHKLLVGCPEERMDALEASIRQRFPHEFSFSRSCPFLFELLPPGSTKGSMLSRLKEYYAGQGVSLISYAVGDYDNDLDMLRIADVACCPENALDSVKAACVVTLQSCNEGAIADLVERIGSSRD
jgi:hydroxymethylpyrimidine pyrophosphatase-like HAD family hydrolase